jgi:23S rRNA pseudouridine1911/1915/1917 synthase
VPASPVPGPLRLVCDDDGVRLDRFLAARMAETSRRRAAAIIAAGAVRVNGRAVAKGQLLRRGDAVDISASGLLPDALRPEPELAVPILYEDDVLIALAKPAGMPAVALHTSDCGTAANFLIAQAPDTIAAGPTPLEAGLVHRLDNGTSGVLLAARSPAAWQALRLQFRRRQVDKRYLAWVDGLVGDGGEQREPIAHHPRQAQLMVTCPDPARAATLRARPAATSYRPIEQRGGATLLAVTIASGVRHQIRVHLAGIGHPLCGDPLYGGSPAPRLMLHATEVAVRHPRDGQRLSISCPPPPDFGVAG